MKEHKVTIKTTLVETFYLEANNLCDAIEMVECGDCIPDYNEILNSEVTEATEVTAIKRVTT